jgi:prepilin peptidase CpaA
MPEIPVVGAAVTLGATALAAWTDLRGFRIPNSLTLPLLATGLVYNALVGGGGPLLGSLLGVLFGGGILFPIYCLGGMGAGDVKLLAGVGAWLGVPGVVYAFIGAGLAGGVYALGLLALGGWTDPARRPGVRAPQEIETVVRRPDRRRRLVPFATMILIGVVVALAWSYLSAE